MLRLIPILAGAALSLTGIAASGRLIAPKTNLPFSVRFSTGAVLFSAAIFSLLTLHLATLPAFLLLALILVVAQVRQEVSPVRLPYVFVPPIVIYLIYALAPEIQPDAAGYHLRLVADYARFHAFTNRLEFFDLLPQGVEMLFVPAFALGGASAAKLVHFAFLITTIPLIRSLVKELGLPERTGNIAAALFFLAPVSGVAGTAAYTDLALVCATSSTFYLLLRWDRERVPVLLCLAALNAGFCYTIKQTFGLVTVAAFVFILIRSRRAAVVFAPVAALVPGPWVLRAYWLSGNPFAPFLNAWFPNVVSSPDLEHRLNATFNAFRPGFSWLTAPLGYTIAGSNQGLLGAAFLLSPLALLAIRKRAGKPLLLATALLALPILANTGTRFLLPALVPASLALASVLPVPLALAAILFQAGSFFAPSDWKLHEIPLRAAFGLEPEATYVARSIQGFAVTRMVADHTRPVDKVFSLIPLPEFYIPRDLLIYWHSVKGESMTDALDFANRSQGTTARVFSWKWNSGEFRSVRFRTAANLRIVDGDLTNGRYPAQSWKPGLTRTIPLAPAVTGASLLMWPPVPPDAEVEVPDKSGAWHPVHPCNESFDHTLDLRRDATSWIRKSGYQYILIPTSDNAFAELGANMVRYQSEWGLEAIDRSDKVWLFRISPLQ